MFEKFMCGILLFTGSIIFASAGENREELPVANTPAVAAFVIGSPMIEGVVPAVEEGTVQIGFYRSVIILSKLGLENFEKIEPVAAVLDTHMPVGHIYRTGFIAGESLLSESINRYAEIILKDELPALQEQIHQKGVQQGVQRGVQQGRDQLWSNVAGLLNSCDDAAILQIRYDEGLVAGRNAELEKQRVIELEEQGQAKKQIEFKMEIASCVLENESIPMFTLTFPSIDFKKNRYENYILGSQQGFGVAHRLIKTYAHVILKEEAARKFGVEMKTDIPRLNSSCVSTITTKISNGFLGEVNEKDPVEAFRAGFLVGGEKKELAMKEYAFILHKDDKPAYENKIRLHTELKSRFAQREMRQAHNLAQQEMQRSHSAVQELTRRLHNIAQQEMRRVFEEDKIRERNKNLRNGIVIGAATAGVAIGTVAYFYNKKA